MIDFFTKSSWFKEEKREETIENIENAASKGTPLTRTLAWTLKTNGMYNICIHITIRVLVFFFLLYTLNGYTINAFLWSFRDHNNSIFPLYDQELGWRNLKNISDFFFSRGTRKKKKKQIVNLPCYLVLKKFAWKKSMFFFSRVVGFVLMR